MIKHWEKFLARMRWNLEMVCKYSKDMDLVDYHDYPDSEEGVPWHFYIHTCKRCGKNFII